MKTRRGITVILMAHRPSTVKLADKICAIRVEKVGRAALNATVGGTNMMACKTRVAFCDTNVTVGDTNM